MLEPTEREDCKVGQALQLLAASQGEAGEAG